MKVVDILSLIAGVLGLAYAIIGSVRIAKAVKITALFAIRQLINRMEEEKGKVAPDTLPWAAMHHTQQELDTLFKSLQKLFRIKDMQAPL